MVCTARKQPCQDVKNTHRRCSYPHHHVKLIYAHSARSHRATNPQSVYWPRECLYHAEISTTSVSLGKTKLLTRVRCSNTSQSRPCISVPSMFPRCRIGEELSARSVLTLYVFYILQRAGALQSPYQSLSEQINQTRLLPQTKKSRHRRATL